MPCSTGMSWFATACSVSRPMPGAAEHGLGHDRAADQLAEQHAGDRQRRQDRVARDRAATAPTTARAPLARTTVTNGCSCTSSMLRTRIWASGAEIGTASVSTGQDERLRRGRRRRSAPSRARTRTPGSAGCRARTPAPRRTAPGSARSAVAQPRERRERREERDRRRRSARRAGTRAPASAAVAGSASPMQLRARRCRTASSSRSRRCSEAAEGVQVLLPPRHVGAVGDARIVGDLLGREARARGCRT